MNARFRSALKQGHRAKHPVQSRNLRADERPDETGQPRFQDQGAALERIDYDRSRYGGSQKRSRLPKGHVPGAHTCAQKTETEVSTSSTHPNITQDQTRSPAINRLRRFSQYDIAEQAPAHIVIRRLSNAVAATFTTLRSKSSYLLKDEQEPLVSGLPKSLRSGSTSYDDGPFQVFDRRRTSLPKHIKTPASITVRKASVAYDSLSRSANRPPRTMKRRSTNFQSPVQIHPPSVELVAFYSEHRQDPAAHGGSLLSDLEKIDTGNLRQNRGRANSRARRMDDQAENQYSGVADCAVTFADVHVAPGTFATDSIAKKASMTAEEVPQRVSTVQFRSRNSVHEVVWREDETVSGSSMSCSSNGSSSPNQTTQFCTIADASSASGNSTIGSRVITEGGFPIPFLREEEIQGHDEPRDSLSQFTWDLNGVMPSTGRRSEDRGDPFFEPLPPDSVDRLLSNSDGRAS